MKIANNVFFYKTRIKPEKQTKYEEKVGAKHLTKEKTKKLYDYYTCDYCKDEIKIEDKWENRKGGIVNIPKAVTGLNAEICLVLCNKCINPVLKEFEEKRIMKMQEENDNHIPHTD